MESISQAFAEFNRNEGILLKNMSLSQLKNALRMKCSEQEIKATINSYAKRYDIKDEIGGG